MTAWSPHACMNGDNGGCIEERGAVVRLPAAVTFLACVPGRQAFDQRQKEDDEKQNPHEIQLFFFCLSFHHAQHANDVCFEIREGPKRVIPSSTPRTWGRTGANFGSTTGG